MSMTVIGGDGTIYWSWRLELVSRLLDIAAGFEVLKELSLVCWEVRLLANRLDFEHTCVKQSRLLLPISWRPEHHCAKIKLPCKRYN